MSVTKSGYTTRLFLFSSIATVTTSINKMSVSSQTNEISKVDSSPASNISIEEDEVPRFTVKEELILQAHKGRYSTAKAPLRKAIRAKALGEIKQLAGEEKRTLHPDLKARVSEWFRDKARKRNGNTELRTKGWWTYRTLLAAKYKNELKSGPKAIGNYQKRLSKVIRKVGENEKEEMRAKAAEYNERGVPEEMKPKWVCVY
jgi:hypothetical protein